MDVLAFKRKNWIKQGDAMVMAVALGEGREGKPQIVTTSALDECVDIGARAMKWYEKRGKPRTVRGQAAPQAGHRHGGLYARDGDRRAGHGRGVHQAER